MTLFGKICLLVQLSETKTAGKTNKYQRNRIEKGKIQLIQH